MTTRHPWPTHSLRALGLLTCLWAPGAAALDVTVTVLLDPNGDGDIADGVPLEGVEVIAYQDLLDGVPTGIDDLPLAFATTDATGTAVFTVVDGTWWFAVNSFTVLPAPAWAEQTYGGRGAFCADGSGGTLQRGAPGPCFGGRTGGGSDVQLQNVGVAEHVAEASGAGPEALVFGFAAGVVTHPRDGDDVPPGAQTVQGSFRQALQNAEVGVADAVRFVPAVPPNDPGGEVFRVTPLSPLPSLTVPVDGRAWCNGITCPLGAQRVWTGASYPVGPVGVGPDGIAQSGDELEVAPLAVPMLWATLEFPLSLAAPAGSVRAMGLQGAGVVAQRDDAVVEDMFIGVDELGAPVPPGLGALYPLGAFNAFGETGFTIKRSLIAVSGGAVEMMGGQVRLEECVVEGVAASGPPAVFLSGTTGDEIVRSVVRDSGFSGVYLDAFGGGGGGLLIEDSTLTGAAGDGVFIGGPGTLSTVRRSWFTQNGGAAVRAQGAADVVAWDRSVSADSAGLGVDLAGPGVTPNDGQGAPVDMPVLTLAALTDDGDLWVVGTVGSPGVTEVRVHVANDDGDNAGATTPGGAAVPHGEPGDHLGACPVLAGQFDCVLPMPTALNTPVALGMPVTALTVNSDGATSEAGPNRAVEPMPEPPDAGVDAGVVVIDGGASDAAVPDAAAHTPDAAAHTPDAAASTPDAAANTPDAAMPDAAPVIDAGRSGDAGTRLDGGRVPGGQDAGPGQDGPWGCTCDSQTPADAAWAGLGLFGLAFAARRRRR